MAECKNSRRYGENHPAAKLTDSEVEMVRRLREVEHWTYEKIAEHMECSKSSVFDICSNRRRNPRSAVVRWEPECA